MRLLVTGAAGQLGQDLVLTGQRAGHQVVACARADLDITDSGAVRRALEAQRPDAVVNCAAYTDVDGAESDEAGAMEVNAHAPARLAAAAAEHGALVVHVSTDYVFDGAKREPYVESDSPRPLGAYGRSKLAGEQAVADAASRHAIVRSSWLFGHGGPNFVKTMLRLAAGDDEIRVVTDQVGCPTWTGHLAPALVVIAESQALGLHHVAASGQCSWHELAQEILRQAGIDRTVGTQRTADMARPAARPAYSVLRSEREDTPTLAPWQDGLAAYLADREAPGEREGPTAAAEA